MNARPVALITGASRGIGRGIALELARGGFDIAGNSTHADPAETASGIWEVKAKAEALGAQFLPVPGDISETGAHDAIIDPVMKRFGRIDVLVNNAGVGVKKRTDILEATPQSYDRVMSVNLRGPFFLTRNAALRMIGQEPHPSGIQPSIVFITSISARVSSPSRAEYCLSKAGLSQAAVVEPQPIQPGGNGHGCGHR